MNIALILAAGKGTRMGSDTPKQFLLINDKPLIAYTIEAFNKCNQIDKIALVVTEDNVELCSSICNKYGYNKVRHFIFGGKTRQESVFNGLDGLNNKVPKIRETKDDDIILIHDGARPLVSEEIIINNIEACKKYKAVTTAIKVKDTIALIKDKEISQIPNRDDCYQIQTPQTFEFSLIYNAHKKAKQNNIVDASDDTSIALMNGKKIKVVEGDPLNFKVTTKEDLMMFENIIFNKQKP